MRYLIDTDWAIDHLHGVDYYSTDPPTNRKDLLRFLSGVSILGIDEEICEIFGKEI